MKLPNTSLSKKLVELAQLMHASPPELQAALEASVDVLLATVRASRRLDSATLSLNVKALTGSVLQGLFSGNKR